MMSLIVYSILSVVTVICMVLLSIQDVKEKMIYSVPVMLLHLMWSFFIWLEMGYSNEFLVKYWVIHLIIYILVNKLRIWGAGDSDLLMLFCDCCLLSIPKTNGYMFVIEECIYLIYALITAILVGKGDALFHKKKFKGDLDVALTPGFAVAVITSLVVGGFMRYAG